MYDLAVLLATGVMCFGLGVRDGEEETWLDVLLSLV
jgi:hypothetical protein